MLLMAHIYQRTSTNQHPKGQQPEPYGHMVHHAAPRRLCSWHVDPGNRCDDWGVSERVKVTKCQAACSSLLGNMVLSKWCKTGLFNQQVVEPLPWLNLALEKHLQEDRHQYHARNYHTKGVQVGKISCQPRMKLNLGLNMFEKKIRAYPRF